MSKKDLNSQVEINKRLLKAFSVDTLKTIFNLTDSKERQEGILNIITRTYTTDQINNFIFDYFSLLKQYSYLYEFKGVLNENWLDNHPAFFSKQKITNSHYIFNLLIPIQYEGYNRTKSKMEAFEFLVPVQIHKKKTVLIVQINLLERDIATITEDKILSPSRNINDDEILKSIIPFANPVTLYKYDLNKGIKHLWDVDEIDALKVKYKKAKSTSQETMDEDNLIKKEMPALYAELIKTPLKETTFRILIKQNLVQHYFVVDPSAGIFKFSRFPIHHNGVNDLIDLVLKNN